MLKVEVMLDRNIVDECLDEIARSSEVVFDLGGRRPFNKMNNNSGFVFLVRK